jgi:hypothetical protein
VVVKEFKDEADLLEMEIGNILPDQKVVVIISLIGTNQMLNGNYQFQIPSAYSPRQYLPMDMGED